MIHQYKLNGYNIVLDICSGSVHCVDDVAYDIIALYEEKSKQEILTEMEAKYLGTDGITKQDIEAFLRENIVEERSVLSEIIPRQA